MTTYVFLFSDRSNLSMASGTWRTSNTNKNTVVAWPGIWPSNLGQTNEQAKLTLPSFLWAIRGQDCTATPPHPPRLARDDSPYPACV